MNEEKDLVEYLKKNIAKLAPRLVEIESVKQFLLWDQIHGVGAIKKG